MDGWYARCISGDFKKAPPIKIICVGLLPKAFSKRDKEAAQEDLHTPKQHPLLIY